MRRFRFFAAALTVAVVFTGWADAASTSKLEMYTATVDRATAGKLAGEGFDVAATKEVAGGMRVDLVLSARERDRLATQGIKLALKRSKAGLTVQQQGGCAGGWGIHGLAVV